MPHTNHITDEHFDTTEMALMVGLTANLEADPDSDDIIDVLIRRCQDICKRVRNVRDCVKGPA